MKFQPVIKWSGSKRSQSEDIINNFPQNIDTYYEPFIGGGSVLFQLLNSNIKVNHYICSDINEELIQLWNLIKEEPIKLSDSYDKMWRELNKDEDIDRKKDYYYAVRDRFNKTKNPIDFLFLSRTCANGLIRYNSKGEFNTSFHSSRPGIHPDKLKDIIFQWSELLSEKDVKFICQDYRNVKAKKEDLIYLDPPYANVTGMYFGKINYEDFWEYLRNNKSSFVLSFDGKTGEKDMTFDVPKDIYSSHTYINNGVSGFGKIHKKTEHIQESLYLNIKK